ncbi:hypothetical protein DICVIV_11164 [Dictyocaulus viviparus]|uniref:7TM GPCR serpentine receptor class x (Srx) domain-containing protein n=1 Tax=Dictyocaulus viviparus TaxID=29172 RepID=A0A0D8XE09_DICVI|nr:hypothetical protein DICVIV_11164 [Dictyocaulus viviparus]
MSNTTEIFSSFVLIENITVSMIIIATGMFGLCSNGFAIVAVFQNVALRNSFGLLCFSRSVTNIGVLLIFLLWIAPMILL